LEAAIVAATRLGSAAMTVQTYVPLCTGAVLGLSLRMP
jgi:hypothetical protein